QGVGGGAGGGADPGFAEHQVLAGEVAVGGGAGHAGLVGDSAHGGVPPRPDQLDCGVHERLAGSELLRGPALIPVCVHHARHDTSLMTRLFSRISKPAEGLHLMTSTAAGTAAVMAEAANRLHEL